MATAAWDICQPVRPECWGLLHVQNSQSETEDYIEEVDPDLWHTQLVRLR